MMKLEHDGNFRINVTGKDARTHSKIVVATAPLIFRSVEGALKTARPPTTEKESSLNQ